MFSTAFLRSLNVREPDPESTWDQHWQVVGCSRSYTQPPPKFSPKPMTPPTPHSAKAYCRKIASTNSMEWVQKEIKRRSNAVGIFRDEPSVLRSPEPSSPKSATTGRPPTAATSQKLP